MSKKDFNLIVKLSILTALVIALAFLLIRGSELTFNSALKSFSYGITASTFIWWWYVNYGWKSSLFKGLFNKPNLNGTWYGKLQSDWIDPATQKGIPPKDLFLVIRQNFLRLHIQSFTNQFIGSSYTENILSHEDFSVHKLIYLYGKETSDIGSQQYNKGLSELRIMENTSKMEGVYYTSVPTSGNIQISRITNRYVESFEEGISLITKSYLHNDA